MEQISSVANKKIKEILKLKERSYRKKEQKFIVEGVHLVNEALQQGAVLTLLGTIEELKYFSEDFYLVNEVIEITDNVAKKISGVVKNQSIFAICMMKKQVIDHENNVLLLDHVQDPGNIGTLIRSSASFNFKTVIASPTSVSFYNEKVLRSTQGNFFHVNLINEYLIKAINDLKQQNYIIIGTSLHDDSKPLRKIKWDSNQRYALIIGNEANGISSELLEMIDVNINIEMEPNVESLNAGVAGSIIMYTIDNY